MIGDKIKSLRKSKFLTLSELGNITNLSASFISDIENNRTQPSLVRLKSIAEALDTSICELLEEDCNIHENKSSYKPESYLEEFIESKELLDELKKVINWNQEDVNELIFYLKAKNIINSSKENQ